MADLIEAFRRATGLIVTIDPSLVEILMLSMQVSLSAIAIANKRVLNGTMVTALQRRRPQLVAQSTR